MAQASRKRSEIVFKSWRDEAGYYFDQEYTTKKEDSERTPVTRGNLGVNLVRCLRNNEDDWPERRRKIVRTTIGVSSISLPAGLGLAAAGIALAFIFGLTLPFAGTALMAIGGAVGGIALFTLIGVSIYRGIKQSIYTKNSQKIEGLVERTIADIFKNNPLAEGLDADKAKNEIKALLASKSYETLDTLFRLSKLPQEVPPELSNPTQELTKNRMENTANLKGKIAALDQLKLDLNGASVEDPYSQQVIAGIKTVLRSIPDKCPTFKSLITKGVEEYFAGEVALTQRKITETLGSASLDETYGTLAQEKYNATRTNDPTQYEDFNTHLDDLIATCEKEGLTQKFFQTTGLAGPIKALSMEEAEKLEEYINNLPKNEREKIKADMIGKLQSLAIAAGSTISLTYTAAAPAPQRGPRLPELPEEAPTAETVEALGPAPELPQAMSLLEELDAITGQIAVLQKNVASLPKKQALLDNVDRNSIITKARELIENINSLLTQNQNNPDKDQQAATYEKAADALKQLVIVTETLGQKGTISAPPDLSIITAALSQPITGLNLSGNKLLEAASALAHALSDLLTIGKGAEITTVISAAHPINVITTPAEQRTIEEKTPAQRISAQIIATEKMIQETTVKPKEFKESTSILNAAKKLVNAVQKLTGDLKNTLMTEKLFTELENNLQQLSLEKDPKKINKLNSALTKNLAELNKLLSAQPIQQAELAGKRGFFTIETKAVTQKEKVKTQAPTPEEQAGTGKETPRAP